MSFGVSWQLKSFVTVPEASPNDVEPATARLFFAPQKGDGFALALWTTGVGDVTLKVWYREVQSDEYINVGGTVTVSPNTQTYGGPVPQGVQVFVQVLTAGGGVTALYSGFLSLNALVAMNSSTTLTTLSSSLAPATNVHSTALEASRVISAGPCVLRSAKVQNTGLVDLYLFVFDATALPIDGTRWDRVPVLIAAGDPPDGDRWDGGTRMDVGCVVALSTTQDTLTIAGAVGYFDCEVEL